jgi:hypothetical protein
MQTVPIFAPFLPTSAGRAAGPSGAAYRVRAGFTFHELALALEARRALKGALLCAISYFLVSLSVTANSRSRTVFAPFLPSAKESDQSSTNSKRAQAMAMLPLSPLALLRPVQFPFFVPIFAPFLPTPYVLLVFVLDASPSWNSVVNSPSAYGSLTRFNGLLTAPKFKIPNVHRVPNGLTAKSPPGLSPH